MNRHWLNAARVPERGYVATVYYNDGKLPITTVVYGRHAYDAEDVTKYPKNVLRVVVHSEIR
jgi:hypothetical protein